MDSTFCLRSICLMLFYIMPVNISVHLLNQQPETKPSPRLSHMGNATKEVHTRLASREFCFRQLKYWAWSKINVTLTAYTHTHTKQTGTAWEVAVLLASEYKQQRTKKGMHVLSLPEAPAIVHLGDSGLKYKEQSMGMQIQGICTQRKHQYIGQQQVTHLHH